MGRFVDDQPAGVRLLRVPATEVIRAVARIQRREEVDGQGPPDHAAEDQLLDRHRHRRVADVEGHAQRSARALHGVEHLAGLGRVGGHGLFADHVTTQLHRSTYVHVVRRIHRRHDYHIGPGGADHLIELIGVKGRHRLISELILQATVVPVHPRLAQVAEAHDPAMRAVRVRQPVEEHHHPPPQPHHRITLVRHRESLLEY